MLYSSIRTRDRVFSVFLLCFCRLLSVVSCFRFGSRLSQTPVDRPQAEAATTKRPAMTCSSVGKHSGCLCGVQLMADGSKPRSCILHNIFPRITYCDIRLSGGLFCIISSHHNVVAVPASVDPRERHELFSAQIIPVRSFIHWWLLGGRQTDRDTSHAFLFLVLLLVSTLGDPS